jgi:RNase P subunit RPR2
MRHVRELLDRGSLICVDCEKRLFQGDAKIAVRLDGDRHAFFWRCGDCQYQLEQLAEQTRPVESNVHPLRPAS